MGTFVNYITRKLAFLTLLRNAKSQKCLVQFTVLSQISYHPPSPLKRYVICERSQFSDSANQKIVFLKKYWLLFNRALIDEKLYSLCWSSTQRTQFDYFFWLVASTKHVFYLTRTVCFKYVVLKHKEGMYT